MNRKKFTVRRGKKFLLLCAVGYAVIALFPRGIHRALVFGRASAFQSNDVFVDRVVDGDTVVLSTKERVRYIGMDTPELHHPHKPVQAYAREAMEFNRNLVEGKTVRLEFDVERRDKYGRLLAYVYLPDGTFVNAKLVRQGYAHLLTIPPNVKYADLFVKCQKEAREARRGLWSSR